uniref:DUF19 domain-containing protein n=1 Tax=Clastoptera arizonana TaxID=38151 RepID=A0A1B6D3A7_9HEMI
MKNWIIIFTVIFLASADELQDQVNKGIAEVMNHIPPGTLDKLPSGLNASNIPSIEEGEELLKKKCDKNGNNESFDNLMVAKEELQFCLHDLINFQEVQKEIEKAKPTGDLDLVFRKYCKKTPVLRNCINNFTTAMEPCLDPNEKDTKKIVANITNALISFICFKEGDRIALFIAEGGPECLSDKNETIQQCLNATYNKHFSADLSPLNDLPGFSIGKKECLEINTIQTCVVKELEKCSEPTPANIIDSLFNFVRKVTPCANYKPPPLGHRDVNGATTSTFSYILISLSLMLVTLFKY